MWRAMKAALPGVPNHEPCTAIFMSLSPAPWAQCLRQVRPLEDQFKFGSFFTPLLHESDFEAKPSVLLLGQYSTGWVVVAMVACPCL